MTSIHRALRAQFSATLVFIVLGSLGVMPTHAADSGLDLTRTVEFDVPAGPLSAALLAFSSQAHVQIVTPGKEVGAARSPGVSGLHTLDAGLNALLSGTGFEYRVSGNNSISVTLRKTSDAGRPVGGIGTSDAALAISPSGPMQASSGESGLDKDSTETSGVSEVVVTGTRLRGVESASPVVELDQSAIIEGGYSTLGQALEALPQNFGGGQTPTNIGAGGIGLGAAESSAFSPNLRGLGPNSTLTLIDGHRLAFDQTEGASDLALIPVAAIESVDIITDGASALYGSDAVGGVVNVRLKANYTGAETSVSTSVPTEGGGLGQRYSQLVGISWGSGNLTAAVEYNHQDPILTSQRSYVENTTPPGSISPELKTDSAFVNFRQELVPAVSFFLEGVYTYKTNFQQVNYQDLYFSPSAGKANQYGVAAGVDLTFPKKWLGSVTVTTSGNDFNLSQGFTTLPVTTGSPTLAGFDNHTTDLSAEANGSLFSLVTGDVRAAVGGGIRWEGIDAASAGTPSETGSRRVSYAFSEISAPIVSKNPDRLGLNALDFDAAVRDEKYSDVGRSTVPKVGVIYQPSPDLKIKSTWSESFRAPTLWDLYSGTGTALYPGSPYGVSRPVLITYNPASNLAPERSKNWTLSGDFRPTWLRGADLSVNYFHIDYSDRIGNPITALSAALTNPVYAPFVIRNPTAAQQQATISTYPFYNYTGASYDPSDVAAIFNNGLTNISVQNIHGVDVTASYSHSTPIGTLGFNASGSWMSFVQEILPGQPADQISATVFNPPKFKSRLQGNWSKNGFGAFLALNYVSREFDNISLAPRTIASWTTADVGAHYDFSKRPDFLQGLRINIAVLNLTDHRPPYVDPADNATGGYPYDPSNASAVGRTISTTITKDW